jgi:hypothetical protein
VDGIADAEDTDDAAAARDVDRYLAMTFDHAGAFNPQGRGADQGHGSQPGKVPTRVAPDAGPVAGRVSCHPPGTCLDAPGAFLPPNPTFSWALPGIRRSLEGQSDRRGPRNRPRTTRHPPNTEDDASATEQLGKKAATGLAVGGRARAALALGHAPQHLFDMLPATPVGGLSAGTAGSRLAHGESPSTGGGLVRANRGGTREPSLADTPRGVLCPLPRSGRASRPVTSRPAAAVRDTNGRSRPARAGVRGVTGGGRSTAGSSPSGVPAGPAGTPGPGRPRPW